MTKPLQVLLIEDSADDAELIFRAFRSAEISIESERVDTRQGLEAALARKKWDVILSDYNMPRFDAEAALSVVNASKLDVPFIVVSGSVGEDRAVSVMKAGANDFILKSQTARLIPAILRELREASYRQERRSMQEQLILSERMVSVGTLAAGVGHEINNPLSAVLGNLHFLRQELAGLVQDGVSPADGEPVARPDWNPWLRARVDRLLEPLQDASDAAERIRVIVRDLRLFSRVEEDNAGPVELQPVIEATLRMASHEVRRRAQLFRDYREVPPVHGNASRLGQVFLNLVVNATQAIPEGNPAAHEIRVVARVEAGRAVVEIHDTGTGIAEKNLARIFDPFFTTKPVGIGTGLGLAICQRIVTDLGGEITVESKEGSGSVFRVWLRLSSSVA